MPQFSANLGFLWADEPLDHAIALAARAGFDAVEAHWPYAVPPDRVKAALRDAGLPLLGINTVRGGQDGDFGLAACPDRKDEALAAIDQALDYAEQVEAEAVHIMAGRVQGKEADRQYRKALEYALGRANGRTLLIEPLNPMDVPGYHLRDTAHALQVISDMGAPNLKVMFDCYHVARTEGDVIAALHRTWDAIGHIQFAAVPDRGAPDHGDLDYAHVFDTLDALGWTRPLGAEYRPDGDTAASLGWMKGWRR